MEKLLYDLNVNESGTVTKISTNDEILSRKMAAMGILKGVKLEVVKKALLGDPISVKVRGYFLSLRKNESMSVTVEAEK